MNDQGPNTGGPGTDSLPLRLNWAQVHSRGLMIGAALAAAAGLAAVLFVGTDAALCSSGLGQFAQAVSLQTAGQCTVYTLTNILGWVGIVGGAGVFIVGWLISVEHPHSAVPTPDQVASMPRQFGSGPLPPPDEPRPAAAGIRLPPSPEAADPAPPDRSPLTWEFEPAPASSREPNPQRAMQAQVGSAASGATPEPEVELAPARVDASQVPLSIVAGPAPVPPSHPEDDVEPLHTIIRRVWRRILNFP